MKPAAQYGCQAQGCQHQIPRGHLMCIDHWRLVPAPLRREVWVAWRLQRRTNSVDNLRAYLAKKTEAIAAVAAKQQARVTRAEASTPSLF